MMLSKCIGVLATTCVLTACTTTSSNAPSQETAELPAADLSAADLRAGAGVYQSLCAFCHGDDGRGGTGGGTSLRTTATAAEVMLIVEGGRNMMPGLSASLNETQIRDVAAYVVDRFGITEQ